ncbi:hypothetical protein LJB95_02780 [Paludibacteraceae bacterium OttesenSCG-928-F17]|nr:hypothetical protein [Paludibacteraceae bacterium OttesenSCG-928-F17]
MKTTPYLFLISLFTALGITVLNAQEVVSDTVINRNVTVEREFRPVIQDAGKMNVYPEISVPNLTKATPQYRTTNSKPLNVDQNIHYLSAASIRMPRLHYNEGFARVGIGTGFNTLADFAYPLFTNRDTKLDFILNHYGFFNKKAHANTQAAMKFTKQLSPFDLYAGIGGNHEFFKYYGKSYLSDMNNDLTEVDELIGGQNNIMRLNANVGLHNSEWEDGWRYAADLGYNLFHSGVNSVNEHQVNVKGGVNGEMFGNRAGINITSSNQFYSTTTNGDVLKNYYVFSLNPYYAIERESWNLNLGLKTYFSINKGRGFSIMPDVHFDWRFAPKYAAIYAGVTGDYKVNTISDITRENLYIRQGVQVDDTYTPLDIFAGVKVKPFNGFLFDVFVDYKMIQNQYFFETDYSEGLVGNNELFLNVFHPIYSKANVFKLGGRISYTYYEKFNIQLNGVYSKWNVSNYDHAWYKPSWELGMNISYKVMPSLSIYANADFSGGRYALLKDIPVKLDAMIDINLGADYNLFKWMTVFLKINNLINNKYDIWHGYEAQGFNLTAGAVFDF